MRSHTIAFKTALLARLEKGEHLSAVAAELGLKPDLVYRRASRRISRRDWRASLRRRSGRDRT